MPIIGILASQNYPRSVSLEYLVVAGGGGTGSLCGGGGAGGLVINTSQKLKFHFLLFQNNKK